MKKIILILLFYFGVINIFSQQLEIGTNINYNYSNIFNSKEDNKKNSIGQPLRSLGFGISTLYYFSDPKNSYKKTLIRIGILYRYNKKGAISEKDKLNYFEFKTNNFGMFFGIGGNLINGYVMYVDLGISYNRINNVKFYNVNLLQTDTFEKFEKKIKPDGFSAISFIGLEKEIISDKLKLFFNVNLNLGLSKINQGDESFKINSVGLNLGLKYIFKLK